MLIGLKIFFENHLSRVCRRPHLGETCSDLEDYLFTLYHIMHYFQAKPLTELVGVTRSGCSISVGVLALVIPPGT